MDSIPDDNFLIFFSLTKEDIYKFRIPSMSIRLKWHKSTRICDCARTIWQLIIIFDHYYICHDAYRSQSDGIKKGSVQTYNNVFLWKTRVAKIPSNYDKCIDDEVMMKNAIHSLATRTTFLFVSFFSGLFSNEPFLSADLHFIFSPRL